MTAGGFTAKAGNKFMEGLKMILEIDRAELREYYKGNIKRVIAEKGGLLWTTERIKHAFNFGNGTEKI